LGFVQTDENLWVKFTDDSISVPHLVVSTTINPVSHTFILKNLLMSETISTNSYEKLVEIVTSTVREYKLKKLID
jgi:hypothetical protein